MAILVMNNGIMQSFIIDEVLNGPTHDTSQLLLYRKWYRGMISVLKALILFVRK